MFRKCGKKTRGPEFMPTGHLIPVLRPCLADGKPATFHRWVDADQGLLQVDAMLREEDQRRLHRAFRETGLGPSGCSVKVLRVTFALVEYPDGSVGKVKPELITFLDREK